MPKMVVLTNNPDFSTKSDAIYQAIKKAPPITVDYQTALENIRLSGGRYGIQPEKRDKVARIAVELEDMDPHDLKVMMISLGIKTDKKMKRRDIITSIRTKLDAVEVVEDDEDE